MSNAIEKYGASLVRASRALHDAGDPTASVDPTKAAPRPHTPGRRGSRRSGLALKGRRVAGGVLAVGVLIGAGTTLFGPQGNPRTTTSIECGGTIIGSVSGNPVADCAARWSSLYHQPAPSLVAWVAQTGGAPVVVPAGTTPAGNSSLHWRQLPAGWTQDRAEIQADHELEDISTGLASHTCWSPEAADQVARTVLQQSGLTSAHIEAKREPDEGSNATCLHVDPSVNGDTNTVTLVERMVPAPPGGSFMTPSVASQFATIARTEQQINSTLTPAASRCATVAQASALWRTRAQTEGIAESAYVLIEEPASGASPAGCARIVVDGPGGGRYQVYAISAPH